MEGYLFKKSSNSLLLNKYNKKYFKLLGLKLYYSESDVHNSKSYIDLANVISITHHEDIDREKLEFIITTDKRSYHIKALMYREAQIWLKVLEVYGTKDGDENFNKEFNPNIILLKALNVVFTHLERNAPFVSGCFIDVCPRQTIKRLLNSLLITIDVLDDMVDATAVSQVSKCLLQSLPESLLTNLLFTPIINECKELSGKAPLNRNLECLLSLLARIRNPYAGLLSRLIHLTYVMVGNLNVTKLDIDGISIAFYGCFVDTSDDNNINVDIRAMFVIFFAHIHELFPNTHQNLEDMNFARRNFLTGSIALSPSRPSQVDRVDYNSNHFSENSSQASARKSIFIKPSVISRMQNLSPDCLSSISPNSCSPNPNKAHSRNGSFTNFNTLQVISNPSSSSLVHVTDNSSAPVFLQKPLVSHSRTHSRNNSFININSRASSPLNVISIDISGNSSQILNNKTNSTFKNGDLPPIPTSTSKDETTNRRRKNKMSEFKSEVNSELLQHDNLHSNNSDRKSAQFRSSIELNNASNTNPKESRTSALTCLLM